MGREVWQRSGAGPAAAHGIEDERIGTPGRRTRVEQALGEMGAALPAAAAVSTTPGRDAQPVQLAAVPGRSVDALFGRPPVQRRITGPAQDGQDVHAAAARGTQGPSTALPFADRIQAAFGPHHDVSSIQAHLGGPAGEAASAMGASAYATGNHVVFGGAPDLHTAAHEAAHVFQQRHGVQLYGGVGEAGDAHERHADAVADAVVAGASAAPLLDQYSGGATAAPRPQVQRAIKKPGDTAHYTVEEVRQAPWYLTLGSTARQEHIERLVQEPAERSNLTVEEALAEVDRGSSMPLPATTARRQTTDSAQLAKENDDGLDQILSELQAASITPSTHPAPTQGAPTLHPPTPSSRALRPPPKKPASTGKPTRRPVLKVEPLDNFTWPDDEEEQTRPSGTPSTLGLPSKTPMPAPTTSFSSFGGQPPKQASAPMRFGSSSQKPKFEPLDDFTWPDEDEQQPEPSSTPSSLGLPSKTPKPQSTTSFSPFDTDWSTPFDPLKSSGLTSRKPRPDPTPSFRSQDDEKPSRYGSSTGGGLTSRKPKPDSMTSFSSFHEEDLPRPFGSSMGGGLTSRKPRPESTRSFLPFEEEEPSKFDPPMSKGPRYPGPSRSTGKPLGTGASMTESSSLEVDLRGGTPIPSSGKDDGKGFIREGEVGSPVWAIALTSTPGKIRAEYDGLALMQSRGVPTVLAGNLSAVRTTSGSTQGFPMRWIANGLSSNSNPGEFQAELEKLSGLRLAAAKQDMALIQCFVAGYVVQDFQAILDPVTGHIYVNDPRSCRARKPDETSPDQQRIASWLGWAGSKPDSSSSSDRV